MYIVFFSLKWTLDNSFYYYRAKGFAFYKKKEKKVQPVNKIDFKKRAFKDLFN